MKNPRLSLVIAVVCLTANSISAQKTTNDALSAPSVARAQALASAGTADRETIVRDMIAKWRPSMDARKDSGVNEGPRDWQTALSAALRTASAERVLAAIQGSTYDDVVAALHGRWTGPAIVELTPGMNPSLAATGPDVRPSSTFIARRVRVVTACLAADFSRTITFRPR